MKAKKSAVAKKKISQAKPKKAVKPASKKLLRFGSGKSNRSPSVIVPEVVDFEIMNFSSGDDSDDNEYDIGNESYSLRDDPDEDEASFDNRSYYRYRNLSNPDRA